MTVFDFNVDSDLSNWMVVDDVVMGGRSNGQFEINDQGHGVFFGDVSLENNGGFSSVRYYCETKNIDGHRSAEIRLRGDKKSYEFRIKSSKYDRQSYVYKFETSGEWQTIEIPLSELQPRFRGMNLNMPNYPAKKLEEVGFLIGNKRNEDFLLEIDYIKLK